MNRYSPRTFVFPSILVCISFLMVFSNALGEFAFTSYRQMLKDSHKLENLPSSDQLQVSNKFPQSIFRWRTEIEFSANKYGLDPNFVAAVMLQESGGQPEVISSSGAVGLMQIMPRDGIAASFLCGTKPCFESRPLLHELLTPEFNIDYGVRMLSGLVKTTGSFREALKAYGPLDVGYYYADIILSIYSSYSDLNKPL